MWKCPKCGREFKNTNQSHYCGKVETIDAYIASQPEAMRHLLQEVRAAIASAAPEATEKIAWSMPYFWQGDNLIGFAAHKSHISLYPGEAAVCEFAERLAGYKTNKGTVRLPIDRSIDHALIADIVRYLLMQKLGTKDNYAYID